MITADDLVIRIFGMGGDLVAAYAQATVMCSGCRAKRGEPCKKPSNGRSVCVSRFKYAIGVLDQKCSEAVIAELARIDEPETTAMHFGHKEPFCEACDLAKRGL